jgi:hypothetical protein
MVLAGCGDADEPLRRLGRFFGRNKATAKPAAPKTEAEQARELERTVQAGVAMHEPPTGLG